MKRLIQFLQRIIKLKVFQNFSYLLIGNIGMQVLNLIAVMIVAKVFKPELFGIYSFMVVQAMLLAAIADLGMRTILIRVAASGSNQLNKVFSINVLSTVFANLIFLICYYFYNIFFGELTVFQVVLIGLCSIANSFNTSIESVYIGKQKMLPIGIANIINSIIWLLFVIFIFDDAISINSFFLIYTVIFLLKPIQLTLRLFNKHQLRFEFSNFITEFKIIFRQALPFWGLVLVSLPANFLANNFLAYNSSIAQVGFFSLSQKFTSPVSLLITLMFTALFPNISVLWSNSKQDFQRVINKSIPAFILFGTFLVIIFLVVIDTVFNLFFSANYNSALLMLKFQIWYVFLFGVASLIGTILTAMHQDKLLFKLALLNGLIITPILWIGSFYGGLGLSISYLLGFVVFLVIEWGIFAKKVELPNRISALWVFPLIIFVIYNSFFFSL